MSIGIVHDKFFPSKIFPDTTFFNRLTRSFFFSQLDPSDPMRQFSFVLQVDFEDKYEVANCEPSIDAAILLEISQRLNEKDDMSYLVRKMRKLTLISLFCEQMHPLVQSRLTKCLYTKQPRSRLRGNAMKTFRIIVPHYFIQYIKGRD